MKRGVTALICCGLALAVFGAVGQNLAEVPYLLAEVPELLQYPAPLLGGEISLETRLFVVLLPQSDLAVILRPISQSEYGSFQVQAIAPEMIDQQMLSAALVLPLSTAQDVATFAPEMVAYLQRMVNWISGFDVFSDAALPQAP